MKTEGPGGTEVDAVVEPVPDEGSGDLVVVGIGASAGGLEAFSRLLAGLPVDTGMAFVLVQHLDPQHPSLLGQLLASRTTMPVHEASDGAEVVADNVYVVPPAQDLLIERGRLWLRPRDPEAQPHLPIDEFLRSLAADRGERALGVILSGAASDGVQGLAAIKSAGGVTFAQEPTSTEYPSMPMSAIGARVVDFVLTPEEIAGELASLGTETPFGISSPHRLPEGDGEAAAFSEIFALLRAAFRVDFSAYKLPTIRRRVARRMLVRRSPDLAAYIGVLREDPAEVDALYRDILIMVTEFFREPETFTVLRERAFPEILRAREDGSELRIWVPGCASGEEAYSLAITLLEVMDGQRLELPVKIFATDISEPDLTTARRGVYSDGVTSAVAPELLRKYFSRTDGGHRVSKSVRELCVFARHDVTSDPPFPNLDLVSCRNLLIYLGPALQRWVIPSLHYGLRPDGYLVLGRSESIGGFSELFEVVNAKQKVFRKLPSSRAVAPFRSAAATPWRASPQTGQPRAARGAPAAPVPPATREADQAVLAGFAPPGVTIDAQRTILEFRGDPGPYLKIRTGRASLNLLELVRNELRGKVRAVVAEAERTGSPAAFRSVPLGRGRAKRTIDVHAVPFATKAGEAQFVVLFEERSKPTGDRQKTQGAVEQAVLASEADQLREELGETRERLEAMIEDQEAANEELRAANEELLSGGEEMQSVNEELETTQEELQSTNQELRARNLELGQVGDDLNNLLTSVSFPIIMVGRDLRIRRFTPAAARLLKVIPSDVGRLITDLRLRIDVPDLEQILYAVMDTTSLTERDVQDDEGRWYAMQVRPYKTLDNRIDGAVVTLFDIDEMKRLLAARKAAEAALRESEARLTIATEAAALGVHDYDIATGTVGWDARVREIWGIGADALVTYDTFLGGVHPQDRDATHVAIDGAMTPGGDGHYHATFRVVNAADGSLRWVTASGQVLFADGNPVRLVGTVEDITERRHLEEVMRVTELAAAEQDERVRLARELHDTATQALFAATLKAEALAQSGGPLSGPAADALEEIQRLSRGALAQMRGLLLELRDEPLEHVPITQLLRQLVDAMKGRVKTVCQLTVRDEATLPPQLHVAVYRIAQEALINVSRHANAAHAWVLLEATPGHVRLRVEDDGQGFDLEAVDPSHLGLRSMGERAADAGAAFSIGERSGGGTVVEMEWDEDIEDGP